MGIESLLLIKKTHLLSYTEAFLRIVASRSLNVAFCLCSERVNGGRSLDGFPFRVGLGSYWTK